MSVTTTANPLTQTSFRLLADYELTHSDDTANDTSAELDTSLNAHPDTQQQTTQNNPSWWPTNFNAIPPHRPINYNLDREQRPWARPGAETAFAFTMLNGVGCVAWFAKAWRATGGKVNDEIFRFSIGGER